MPRSKPFGPEEAERQRIRRAERKANPRPGDEEAQKARSKKRWHTIRKHDANYRAKRNDRLQERRRAEVPFIGPPTWKKIGATIEDFFRFWELQKGLCGICKKPLAPIEVRERGKVTHFDHCHETGKLRGLLCFSCNHKLGFVEKYRKEINSYLDKE